jgi:putative ABC transport system ATP-binding protein
MPDSADPAPLLELRGVVKTYHRGGVSVEALRGIDVRVERGEWMAVTGPSGSGKSTLLAILGLLDRPSRGEYRLEGTATAALDDDTASHVRNRRVGFVFQSFHLIPTLTVQENVETPLLYARVPEREWGERAARCLERVGLAHRATHLPTELSGGEAQRAAVARALVCEPALLLADEPTGNLDTATGSQIAALLEGLHAEGRTVILVTHNEQLAARSPRVLRLVDGQVVADERRA